ncbi:hypothetical protein ACOMHN_019194 [Nucella lapillus]
MHFAGLSVHNQPHKLPSGLFNCSVMHYLSFCHHLDCNHKAECEDGRDETEHCPFSSPGCQGVELPQCVCIEIICVMAGVSVHSEMMN